MTFYEFQEDVKAQPLGDLAFRFENAVDILGWDTDMDRVIQLVRKVFNTTTVPSWKSLPVNAQQMLVDAIETHVQNVVDLMGTPEEGESAP